jgi:hypothetical protein
VFVSCNTQICMYQPNVNVQPVVSEDWLNFCFDLRKPINFYTETISSVRSPFLELNDRMTGE